jgi:enolase
MQYFIFFKGEITMYKIEHIKARLILDSRGNPTIETDLTINDIYGRAAIPSGASVGTYEALELRDGNSAFHGKGVDSALKNVNEILKPKLVGLDFRNQEEFDALLCETDGTTRKSRLGANAILSCSLAFARAVAEVEKIPLFKYISQLTNNKSNVLPVPAMNVINGGAHADNDLDVQEHMILPVGAKSFKECMQMGSEIYFELKKLLKKNFGQASINVGDEGGFAPNISKPSDALEIIIDAITECGYSGKVMLGLDCAASEFYDKDKEIYTVNKKAYTTGELIDYYADLVSKYPIISIEDGFSEDDWDGFTSITKKLGDKIQIIGDDLFVTNMDRLQKGIDTKACNCLLLKVNQIGTLHESLAASKLSYDNGYGVMVSHRSGETEDTFISDLVVGICAGQIKSGAPARSDRTAKYNQLLRIEEELGSDAIYAGNNFRQLRK